MPILVLHKESGSITLEDGWIDEYARDHGFDMTPAILDGDVCVKLLLHGHWVATAQLVPDRDSLVGP